MYLEYYKLTKFPFSNTPDTEFFFASEQHVEAIANLIYTISERKGFAVISGEIGSGKTLTSRQLLNRLDSNIEAALISNTCIEGDDILKTICEEFGLPSKNMGESQLLSTIHDYLIRSLSNNKNVVLLVDEAQNLTVETLEKIRMLSNLETEKEKLIQIILLGQTNLKELLHRQECEQLRQRIHLWFHLKPLSFSETRDYIRHRIFIAEGNVDKIFTPSAIEALYRYSKGVPRIVNTLCDNALLIGFVRSMKKITKEVIQEVQKDLGGKSVDEAEEIQLEEVGKKSKLSSFYSTSPIFALASMVVVFAIMNLVSGESIPHFFLPKKEIEKKEQIVKPSKRLTEQSHRQNVLSFETLESLNPPISTQVVQKKVVPEFIWLESDFE